MIGLKQLTVHGRTCQDVSITVPLEGAAAAFSMDGLDASACSGNGNGCVVVLEAETLSVVSTTVWPMGGDLNQLATDLVHVGDDRLVLLALPPTTTLQTLMDTLPELGGNLQNVHEPTSRAAIISVNMAGAGVELVVQADDRFLASGSICAATPYSVNSVECQRESDIDGSSRNGCRAFCLGKSCTVESMCLAELPSLAIPPDPDTASHRRRRDPDSRRRVDRRRQGSVAGLTQRTKNITEPPVASSPVTKAADERIVNLLRDALGTWDVGTAASGQHATAEADALKQQMSKQHEDQAAGLRTAMHQYSQLLDQVHAARSERQRR